MSAFDLLIKYKRYAVFALQYFIWEKPRGLDFTMRDITLGEKTNGKYNGYSKTNEKHIHDIFKVLNITEDDALIDIGCGKGVVLREASRYPFSKISGIDIQEHLIETAKKNFDILKLSDCISCTCADALSYRNYGDYNTFFFFNPFCEEVFMAVIKRITELCGKKKIHIIYHNPVFGDSLEATGLFEKKFQLYDKMKQYDTCIYVSK